MIISANQSGALQSWGGFSEWFRINYIRSEPTRPHACTINTVCMFNARPGLIWRQKSTHPRGILIFNLSIFSLFLLTLRSGKRLYSHLTSIRHMCPKSCCDPISPSLRFWRSNFWIEELLRGRPKNSVELLRYRSIEHVLSLLVRSHGLENRGYKTTEEMRKHCCKRMMSSDIHQQNSFCSQNLDTCW